MSKSRPKSQSKSRKQSLAKGKLAAKASMEERKSFFRFVLEFFLPLLSRLWELFSFGPSEENEEPSLSLERPDAASSSSALAAPSGMSVAAKRASEEQTEGLAGEILSFGTIDDKVPCDGPNSTGYSNEALTLDPEVLEAEFSRNGVMVGEHLCLDRVGFRKLKKEEAKVNLLERLPVIEDDEIKSERPGSDSGYWKREHDDLKKERDGLKKKCYDLEEENDGLKKKCADLTKKCVDLEKKREVFEIILQLRETLSRFIKKPEGKIRDDRLKEEVLKLPAAKCEKIDMIIGKSSYSNSLRTMFFQKANMTLKSNFSSSDWREHHRFPKFSDGDADYQFWEENFDRKILERRLGIFREAAKNLDPALDMFMIIELVSKLNSELHPQPRENECDETDEVKMSRLLIKACTLRSWWGQ